MAAGEARYALLLNDSGGVRDDLFIYRMEGEAWFIVVNAGNREGDFGYMTGRLAKGLILEDISGETYMIALQGPRAVELLDAVSGGALSAIPRASMTEAQIMGVTVRLGRTGYTGEDGAELFFDPSYALDLWEYLLGEAERLGIEAGPVGLAARDSLRFEAGMPLHGHEITPEITPLEALLSWACDFSRDFTGKEALLWQKERGISRKLCTLNVEGGVPREGCRVLGPGAEEAGRVVSGMFCPTVGTFSANAFTAPDYARCGTSLSVEIRGNPKAAVVVKRPLYIPVYRRNQT
jgi:glycine cleavage system T protein